MAEYILPKRGVAYVFEVSLVSQADTKLFQQNPTLAAGDVKVQTDDGTLSNITTLPTGAASSSRVKVSLSAAEMTGDNVYVQFRDAAGSEWCDLSVNIQTATRAAEDLAYPATSGRSLAVTAAGGVTLADGAHGGTSASLALGAGATISNASGSALTLTSSGGNGHGLLAQGNGTGSGFALSGGATGNGLYSVGDGTGHGAYFLSGDGTIAYGVLISSQATLNQRGLYVEDGLTITSDNGVGALISSTATDTNGMEIAGAGTGGDLVADITGSLSGNVSGKVLGGGAGTITGTGARVVDSSGNDVATSANQTTILARLGAFTGTGVNTVLGFLKSLLSKTATTPSDVGGTFDPATDSTEALRDRGDAAWTTATGFSTLDAAGVRTAVGLATANLDTQLSAISGYLDTEIAAILAAVDTEVAAIKAKTDNLPASPAATADIETALASTARAELAAVPAANASIVSKIAFLSMLARNKVTQSATTLTLYADDGTTAVGTSTISDNGTLYTRGELA